MYKPEKSKWTNNIQTLLLSLAFVLILPASAVAQCTVKGVLYDESNGEAIPFANVVLDGTRHGASTDLNGFFLINRIASGTYTLRVRYVGYNDHEEQITLQGKQTVTLKITLKPTATQLEDFVVSDTRTAEQQTQTQVSVEKITATQIQQMPSIGGQSDIAQYLQVLPGINSTGDQGGQLYIRGGSMIQNLCMLDGMIVYNPFHSIGLYSVFETDLILNANIYTGGFGATYGGRLSSVMDITTRDGNKRHHTGKVGVNTFGASLVLEGPLKRESAQSKSAITYILSAKNSYLSKTGENIYPYLDSPLPYDFLDLYGKLTINSGTGSKVSFFGFRFDDKVDNYQFINDYHWRNTGMGTNFVLMTGTSSLLEGTLAYSSYEITLDDGSNDDKRSGINGFNMNIGVTNFVGSGKVHYGVAMEQYSTDYSFYNTYGLRTEQQEHTNNISAYITYHAQWGGLLFDPGLRYTLYSSLDEGALEPRLSMKYNINNRLRLKLAGGWYSQVFLDARSDNDIVNLFSGFLTGSGNLNKPDSFRGESISGCVQRAQHLIVGMEYDITRHLNLNIEGYYKNFSQLLNANHNKRFDRFDDAYTNPQSPYYKEQYYMTDYMIEDGVAYGVDLSLCYDIERLYLWATYSIGSVKRRDEKQSYHPHYDRRHTINVMATYAIGEQREWEVSMRWSYGSGFPYTQTQGVYEMITSDDIAIDYTESNGTYGLVYGSYYGGRLPSYHRMDVGIKRKISIGTRSLLEINAGVTNLYNRKNIFYFDRMTLKPVYQLPILWSAGMSFSF